MILASSGLTSLLSTMMIRSHAFSPAEQLVLRGDTYSYRFWCAMADGQAEGAQTTHSSHHHKLESGWWVSRLG